MQSPSLYLPPPPEALEVIFADDAMIVVNKPAGLLSVPGRGADKADCMAARIQAEFADALIVHRLDMSTSGLLLLARGATMHRLLSMAFQDRDVSKRYLALVAGRLADTAGEVSLPLICDWPNRPRQKVDFDVGKPSLTRYLFLDYDVALEASRVALEPITGRSHQLRVHMQQLGHPILGDDLYAPPAIRDCVSRLMLHAEALQIRHPVSGEVIRFHCAAPF